ncbi:MULTISPECIES: TerD family protein [Streptomyces]|uniref:Stress protein n=3 Tax=Streptomyces TaxID=1883 RepID=A0A8A1UVI1_STRR1|nr:MULTISPECIES: TerD family protein [Streptomyces]KOG79122.1 stress protein [Kitasatospora aureofaciens]KEF04411.1 stress protein [Streptomyces rimosus]KOT29314.1 stress protein [Streptomyces rimosus subsp. rimosus]KOT29613.1 stress protein [Streptomyces sp. NRRL WC-3701]KOT51298.1 stress protein [Streptomyces rimosus subsp. rimosus]
MAREFQRGHKARISDLTAGTDLYVGVQIAGSGLTFDISCFGLDADERLSDDRYFVFFNQPASPEGAIQQLGPQAGDTESFRVTLDRIPRHIQKLSFTATLDGAGQMSQVGPGYLRIVAGGEEVARYAFNGGEFTTERAVMLGDFYLKGEWRFAAVGQGFDGGLEALLKNFGGEVAEEEPAAGPAPQGGVPGFAPPAASEPAPGFAVPTAQGQPAPAPAAPQPPAPAFGAPPSTPQGAPQGQQPYGAPQPPAPPRPEPQIPPQAQPPAPPVHSAPTIAAPMVPPGAPPGRQPPFGQDPYQQAPPAPYGRPPQAAPQAPPQAPPQASYGQPGGQFPGQQAPAPYGAPQGQPSPYGQPSAQGPGLGVVLDKYREAPTGQRWTPQNEKLIRADLGIDGQPVLARQGSMVLYQGKVDFSYKGAGIRGRIVGNATGQEMQLMRCTGQGQVFFADNSAHVHPIELQGDAICVSSESVLAFDESLQHEVRRIEGHGIPGGALFTMQFQGTGTVVVKTRGTPVVLPVTPTTFADANAIVAWSAASQVIISSQVSLRRHAYPGHSGETVNLQFRGAPGNFIVVQPYEV